MNFLVNLPCNQFDRTQNPTYVSGSKFITEVALLNSNKEPLVVAKTSIPIKRLGTQVFAVKLDF
jgi:chorismate-pyruvate lyase